MHTIHPPAQDGMTLVELLITMAIISMLMLTLMGSYDVGVRSWEKSKLRTGKWQDALQLQNTLELLFSATVPVEYVINNGDRKNTWFFGSPSEMQFMSRGAVLARPGITFPVKLYWEKKDTLHHLMYIQGKSYTDPWRGIEWDETSLLSLFSSEQSGSFRYEAGINPPPPGVFSFPPSMQGIFRTAPEYMNEYDSSKQGKLPLNVSISMVLTGEESDTLTFPCRRETMSRDLAIYMTTRSMSQ